MTTYDVTVRFFDEEDQLDTIEHWEVAANSSEEADDIADLQAAEECKACGHYAYTTNITGC